MSKHARNNSKLVEKIDEAINDLESHLSLYNCANREISDVTELNDEVEIA